MKKKTRGVLAAVVIAFVLVLLPISSAFALSGETAEETSETGTGAATENTIAEGEDAGTETDTNAPLTPEGNLTLVDDRTSTEDTTRQFLTVVTSSGNYFYIIIDRTGDTQNVYFLNLVEESDLMALIEEGGGALEETPALTPTPTPVPEPTDTEEKGEASSTDTLTTPDTEAGGIDITPVLAVVFILALIGGSVLFFVKVIMPKRAAKRAGGGFDFGEFTYDEEDEDVLSYGVDVPVVGETDEKEREAGA